jgi:glutamyl-tRNA synthetase/glutamyl-Q tRNA(Asp) synthetase
LRAELPAERVAFADLILGPQVQVPAQQCGDVLLQDRNGHLTYQLAVVLDDLDQGIDLVVRGQDLTASTGRQIQLARLLGRTRDATFAHHPLLTDDAGKKLGKRFLSEAVAKRRAAGERGEDVLGEALWRAGLLPAARPVSAAELPELVAPCLRAPPAPRASPEDER